MNKQQVLERALAELVASKNSSLPVALRQVQIDRAKSYIRLAEAMEGSVRNIKEPTA